MAGGGSNVTPAGRDGSPIGERGSNFVFTVETAPAGRGGRESGAGFQGVDSIMGARGVQGSQRVMRLSRAYGEPPSLMVSAQYQDQRDCGIFMTECYPASGRTATFAVSLSRLPGCLRVALLVESWDLFFMSLCRLVRLSVLSTLSHPHTTNNT